jgi:hypothetical protein
MSFFGILILSTCSSLFILHCAINYYFPLILVVLSIIYFMPMTSSNRSERKISLTMVQSVIFYYRITFWIFRLPVIFIHYICREIILVLVILEWKCISINRMGQWGRCTFMAYECMSYKIIWNWWWLYKLLNPSAWSDGHCPHAARSHSFVYISTS